MFKKKTSKSVSAAVVQPPADSSAMQAELACIKKTGRLN